MYACPSCSINFQRPLLSKVILLRSEADDNLARAPAAAVVIVLRVHLGILVMLLVAVLYLSLFVNVGASDNFWLMFLWRAITVILPLFLIIRCVAALYTWRQQYLAHQAARA
jgi:biotin transporter BioY